MSEPVEVIAICDEREHEFKPSRLLVDFRSREDELKDWPATKQLHVQICINCGVLRFPDVSKEVLR